MQACYLVDISLELTRFLYYIYSSYYCVLLSVIYLYIQPFYIQFTLFIQTTCLSSLIKSSIHPFSFIPNHSYQKDKLYLFDHPSIHFYQSESTLVWASMYLYPGLAYFVFFVLSSRYALSLVTRSISSAYFCVIDCA